MYTISNVEFLSDENAYEVISTHEYDEAEFLAECNRINRNYYHVDAEFQMHDGARQLDWESFEYDGADIVGVKPANDVVPF